MGKTQKEKMKKTIKRYLKILSPDHKYSPSDKNGWIFEHRLVVENFIKRALKSGEVVHHLNEIKTDNRIENLMVFKSNAEHQSFHRKIQQFGMTRPVLRQINERWKNYPVEINIIPIKTKEDINNQKLL